MDLPITGNFKPEELHSYPPKMVCTFFPEDRANFTTCDLVLHGFDRPVNMSMALQISRPLIGISEFSNDYTMGSNKEYYPDAKEWLTGLGFYLENSIWGGGKLRCF